MPKSVSAYPESKIPTSREGREKWVTQISYLTGAEARLVSSQRL